MADVSQDHECFSYADSITQEGVIAEKGFGCSRNLESFGKTDLFVVHGLNGCKLMNAKIHKNIRRLLDHGMIGI